MAKQIKNENAYGSADALGSNLNLPKLRNQADGLDAYMSDLTGLECTDPSLTKQSDVADADINTILDRYTQTGLLTSENKGVPKYGDFLDVSDFHESMNVVTRANELFAQLPAKLRDRFGNNPEAYVDFVLDPSNRDEAIKLGILEIPDLPAESEDPPAPQNAGAEASAPLSEGVSSS